MTTFFLVSSFFLSSFLSIYLSSSLSLSLSLSLSVGEVLSLVDDLFSGLGSSCVVAGRHSADSSHPALYTLVFKCLEPDSLYK